MSDIWRERDNSLLIQCVTLRIVVQPTNMKICLTASVVSGKMIDKPPAQQLTSQQISSSRSSEYKIWKCKLKSLMEGYFFWKKKLLNKEYHPEKLCCCLVAFICYHWTWLCASQDTDFDLFMMQLLKFYPRFEKRGSYHSSYSITSAGYELLSENILGFSSW